jgi:hypothetical protein
LLGSRCAIWLDLLVPVQHQPHPTVRLPLPVSLLEPRLVLLWLELRQRRQR